MVYVESELFVFEVRVFILCIGSVVFYRSRGIIDFFNGVINKYVSKCWVGGEGYIGRVFFVIGGNENNVVYKGSNFCEFYGI